MRRIKNSYPEKILIASIMAEREEKGLFNLKRGGDGWRQINF